MVAFLSVLLMAVAFAMDAFAVSLCKGLSLKKVKIKYALCAGAWFGGFQIIMPLIGYFLSEGLLSYIEKYDHWVAFLLLLIIGINMIRESFSSKEEGDEDFSFKTMSVLAIATSIDALAGGVTISVNGYNVWLSAILIGVSAFAFSFAGVYVGNKFGSKYKNKAEFCGGAVLILLGLKILLESIL